MGLPIAARLAQAGFELTIFDVQPDRLDQAANLGQRSQSLLDAVQGADAIFSVLPADSHVDAVSRELAGICTPGQVYVDFSTIAPATIEQVARRLSAVDVQTVSVAVTRGTAAAELGELALFVGGGAELSATLRAAFDSIATDVRLVDGLGAAKALKIANNMVVSCLDVVICEALVIGEQLGIVPEAVTSALAAGGADSWALRNHIVRFVLPDDLGPGHFSTRHMAKDVGLFIELAAEHGLAAPLAGVAAACYRGVIAYGWGDNYHPIVIRWLERAANSPRPSTPARTDSGDGRSQHLRSITAGVAAVQALASFDALAVLLETGINEREAAAHLESGSAGNDSLCDVAEQMSGGRGLSGPNALAEELAGAIDVARFVDVPALMLEIGRSVALGHARNGAR